MQEVREFEKALRSLVLNENNDIYVTGSNAKMLSGELATYLGDGILSSRYIVCHILSFYNFMDLKIRMKVLDYILGMEDCPI